MESPVVIEKPPEYHGSARDNERGFPFDEEEGSGAWSELASRHPDIAARLRQRPATWARKRRPSSQDATEDFGESFGGFDRFPFDDIPPEFREHFPSTWNRRFSAQNEPDRTHPQPQTSHSPQPSQPPPQSPQHQTAATQTEQDSPHQDHGLQPHLPQYGLRNTVDLGQKSPADPSLVDAEERNQRCNSAPPDNRQNQSTSKMSAQNHQEPHADQPQQASNVRHIPIFVEGRDEPVINKSDHFGEAKQAYVPPPPHAEREQYFDDSPAFHPPPNFSRAFGTPFNKGFRQGPQPFTQQKVYPQAAFNRGASPQRSQSPKPQSTPQHHEEYVKVPVQHEPPRPEPRASPRPAAPPQQPASPQQPPPKQPTPPPQPPAPKDPITLILSIQTDVLNLMSEVENFTGTKKDKRYLFLDEMLTRNLIKLDNIETEGKENIRQARKEAIRCIEKCIAVLEAKAEKGSIAQAQQDLDMKENAEAANQVTENGESEMKEAPKKEAPKEEAEVKEEQQPNVESQESEETQPQANAEAADTRPVGEVPATTENTDQELDKNASSKKGGKNVKKRDKSKDKKDKDTKDSNKEEAEKKDVMQVDDKGDKTYSQTMEVDGAASQ